MEKGLKVGEMIKRGYLSVERTHGILNEKLSENLQRYELKVPDTLTYELNVFFGSHVYVELGIKNVRDDIKPGKTYTEEITVTIDVDWYTAEYVEEDVVEELAKVVRQFAVHKMLSHATAHRLQHTMNAMIQVRQPELEISGVLKND